MKPRRFLRTAVTAMAVSMLAASASAATMHGKVGPNLLANSGFESGLTGWTTTGFFALGFDYGVDSQAHSGSSAFYGGAVDGLGFLTQTIPTVPGSAYGLSLWLLSDGFLPNEFTVSTNGAPRLDLTDTLIGPYRLIALTFFASGPTTTLQFGFRNDSGYLHLDDVNVSLAPEPATVSLLGLGLVALVARRRKQLAA